MRDCCYERDSGTEERDSGNNPLYEPRAGVTADLDPPGPYPLADLDPPSRIWTPPPNYFIFHTFSRELASKQMISKFTFHFHSRGKQQTYSCRLIKRKS